MEVAQFEVKRMYYKGVTINGREGVDSQVIISSKTLLHNQD